MIWVQINKIQAIHAHFNRFCFNHNYLLLYTTIKHQILFKSKQK